VGARGSGAFAVALGVTLLLLLVGVPLASALGRLYEAILEGWQFVEVEVEVVDESGAPAGPAHVAAFELADGGPKLLAEGRASLSGVFKFGAKVPRRLVAELENGTRIYAPLNLWIIAWREDNLLATLTQPIDVTTMKHPLDTLKLRAASQEDRANRNKRERGNRKLVPVAHRRGRVVGLDQRFTSGYVGQHQCQMVLPYRNPHYGRK
jgi:hypothetical protein